jgi:hypothetical protein
VSNVGRCKRIWTVVLITGTTETMITVMTNE